MGMRIEDEVVHTQKRWAPKDARPGGTREVQTRFAKTTKLKAGVDANRLGNWLRAQKDAGVRLGKLHLDQMQARTRVTGS